MCELVLCTLQMAARAHAGPLYLMPSAQREAESWRDAGL